MGRPKKSKPFRYLVRERSRHGKMCLYYREPGQKRYRINVDEDHPDFADHYTAAKAKDPLPPPDVTVAKKPEPAEGTLDALVRRYAASAEFKKLKADGQRFRLQILEACCAELRRNGKTIGSMPVDRITKLHIDFLKDQKAGKPGAANNRIKYLRILFGWADVTPNPALRTRMLPPLRKDGFHAWSLREIASYEKRHPVGTSARLALDLALFTAARRADIVLLGPENVTVEDECAWISFVQSKTGGTVEIPILEELAVSIAATPGSERAFLITQYGEPYTAAGLGNAFREWADDAGLKECSLHGLRKAAAAKLAELGASEEEIKAITGHATSREVNRYTKSARRKIMAASAMARLRESMANRPKLLEGPKEPK